MINIKWSQMFMTNSKNELGIQDLQEEWARGHGTVVLQVGFVLFNLQMKIGSRQSKC